MSFKEFMVDGILSILIFVGLLINSLINKPSADVSKEHCEMQILRVEHSVDSDKDYTIFTVQSQENTQYTLPSVSTTYVREYQIGDSLPVILFTHHDGTYSIKTDVATIKSSLGT